MRVLITGGAGFIGCNAAKRFLEQGNEVVVFDNLSRRGADKNLKWLKAQKGNLSFIKGDVRNGGLLNMIFSDNAFGKIDLVLHMAAQVAVTTSVMNPREDFEINGLGTFNLLEAIRISKQRPVIINASTNKVYGKMETTGVIRKKTRYQYKKLPNGVSENMPLDFYSPYGCSKGAADQYVMDYGRIYGIKTINFRQSCIYGPRQFGVEDQGWVAHFIISIVKNRPITIYGDGKQVRDILYIDDLLDAFESAVKKLKVTCGRSYNIGGGSRNSISLLEFIHLLEDMIGKEIPVSFKEWRPGDQRVYISDIGRVKKELGWKPKVAIKEGIASLFNWVRAHRTLFDDF